MRLKIIIVAFAVFGMSPTIYAQGFPNKPIELVVSSSPGGGIDLIFRLLAEDNDPGFLYELAGKSNDEDLVRRGRLILREAAGAGATRGILRRR